MKSSAGGRDKLAAHFHCEEGEIRENICELLFAAYKSSGSMLPADDYALNACLFPNGLGNMGHVTFKKAFAAAVEESGRDMIECICASRLSLNSNVTAGFFTTVLGAGDSDSDFTVMLLFSLPNPLTGKQDTVICFDRATLKNEFEAYRRQLAFLPKILKFISKTSILQESETQHLYNFVMDGQLRCFLDYMQPICMPRDMYAHFADKYDLNYKKGTFSQ